MNKILYSPSQPRKKNMMQAPINDINEDYLRLKKDYRAKISDRTLEYLQYREVITKEQLDIYRAAARKPEDRKIVTFINVVIDINRKFLEFFETI
jgi:hypothetical protein